MSAQRQGHNWAKPKWMNYHYCVRCGLIALKNERTQAAIRAGCEADE